MRESKVDVYYNSWLKTYQHILGTVTPTVPPLSTFIGYKQALVLFHKHIKARSKILIFADVDVDGILSCFILHRYLELIGFPKSKIDTFINKGKQHGISDDLKEHIKQTNPDFVIIVDSSSNQVEDIKSLGVPTLVIDHHEITHNELRSDDYIIINNTVTEYKDEHFNKDCDLSCGMVVYEFLRMYEELMKSTKLEESLLVQWALMTLFTDVIDLDSPRSQYYIDNYLMNGDIERSLWATIKEVDSYSISLNKSFINYKFAPRINKSIRVLAGLEALNLMIENPINLKSLDKYIGIQDEMVAKGLNMLVDCGNYVYVDLGKHIERTFSGVIANKLVHSTRKNSVVFKVEDGVARGSFRGRNSANYREYVASFENATAEGHNEAFGFSCKIDDLDKIFSNINSVETQDEAFGVTFGDNIKQGISHADSLLEYYNDGSLYKIALVNSRLSSKNDTYIYFNFDSKRYTFRQVGKSYRYDIDGVEVISLSELHDGLCRVYVELDGTRMKKFADNIIT